MTNPGYVPAIEVIGARSRQCFIDYRRTPKHLAGSDLKKKGNCSKPYIDGKDLWIIKTLYWNQTAPIRYKSEIGQYGQLKKKGGGVTQGYVLSLDPFFRNSENIMRKIIGLPGIKIGRQSQKMILYRKEIT